MRIGMFSCSLTKYISLNQKQKSTLFISGNSFKTLGKGGCKAVSRWQFYFQQIFCTLTYRKLTNKWLTDKIFNVLPPH